MSVPFMRLFVADYQADTMHLSTAEHGAYLLLLMNYWQRGKPLPADDKKLARIAGLGPREWQRVKPVISEFFEIGCSEWLHKRVESEIAYMHSMSLKKRKGGLARAEQMHSERKAPAQQTDTEADTEVTVSKDTGADAPFDPAAIIFKAGVALITSAGKSEAHARSWLGKARKEYGDGPLVAAIGAAKREGALDPIAFMQRSLGHKSRADEEYLGP
jgi:uncharacterized protein YdaU (DUF1376 family)